MLPGGGMAKGLRELLMEPPVVNGPPAWTLQEELLLAHAVMRYGTDDWKLVAQTLEGRAPLHGFGGRFSPELCEAHFGLLHARCGALAAGPDGIAGSISSYLRAQRLAELRNGLAVREDSISLLKVKIQSLESARLTLRSQRPKADVIPHHFSANSLPPQQPLPEATAQSLPLHTDGNASEGAATVCPAAEANGFETDTSSWGVTRPPLPSTPQNGSDQSAQWGAGIPLAGRLLAPTLSQEMASWLASGAAPLFADDGTVTATSEHSREGSEASDNVPGGRSPPGLNLDVEEHSTAEAGAADVIDDVAVTAVRGVGAGEKGGVAAVVSPTVTPTSLLEAHAVEALREEGQGEKGTGDEAVRVENERGNKLDVEKVGENEGGEETGKAGNEGGEEKDVLATEEGERVGKVENEEGEPGVALGVEGGKNDGAVSGVPEKAEKEGEVPVANFEDSRGQEPDAFAVRSEEHGTEGRTEEVKGGESDSKPEKAETEELGEKPDELSVERRRDGVLEGLVEKPSSVNEEAQPRQGPRSPLERAELPAEQTDGTAEVSKVAVEGAERTGEIARVTEETAKEAPEVAGNPSVTEKGREAGGSAVEDGNENGNGPGGKPVAAAHEQPPAEAFDLELELEREDSEGAEGTWEAAEEPARAESPDIEARLEQWLRSKMEEREPEPEPKAEPEPEAESELDVLLGDKSASQSNTEEGVQERQKAGGSDIRDAGKGETDRGRAEGSENVDIPMSASILEELKADTHDADAIREGAEGAGQVAEPAAESLDEERPTTSGAREERPRASDERPIVNNVAVPEEPLAGLEDRPGASEERPNAFKERPVTSEERPVVAEEFPVASEERPVLSEEARPAAFEERPVAFEGERPTESEERPLLSGGERPAASAERPVVSKRGFVAASEERPVLSEAVEEKELTPVEHKVETGTVQLEGREGLGLEERDANSGGGGLGDDTELVQEEARETGDGEVVARPAEDSAQDTADLLFDAIGEEGAEATKSEIGGTIKQVGGTEGGREAGGLVAGPEGSSASLEDADVRDGNDAGLSADVAEDRGGLSGDDFEDPSEAVRRDTGQEQVPEKGGFQKNVDEGLSTGVEVSGGLSGLELPTQEENPPSELVSETRLPEQSTTGMTELEAEGLETKRRDSSAGPASASQEVELGQIRGPQEVGKIVTAEAPPQPSGGVDQGAPATPTLRLVMEESPGNVGSHDAGASLETQKPDALSELELNSGAAFPKRLFDAPPLPRRGLDLNADAVDDVTGPFDDVTGDVMGLGKPVLDLNQEPQEAALLKEGGALGGELRTGGEVAAASEGGGDGGAESERGVMYSAESAPSAVVDQSVVQRVVADGFVTGGDGEGEGTSPVVGLRESEEIAEEEMGRGRAEVEGVEDAQRRGTSEANAVGKSEERAGVPEDSAGQSRARGTRVGEKATGVLEGALDVSALVGTPKEDDIVGEDEVKREGALTTAESSGSKRKLVGEAEVENAKRVRTEIAEPGVGVGRKEATAPFDLNAPVADVSIDAGDEGIASVADVSLEPGGEETVGGGAPEGGLEMGGVIDIRSTSEGPTESESKAIAGAKGKVLKGTALARAVKAQRAAERKAALEAERQGGGEENEDGEKVEEVSESGGKSASKKKGGASNTGPARAALAAKLLSKAQRRAAINERGGTPDSTAGTPSPRDADVSTPLGSEAADAVDSDDPPSPPVEYDSPDDEGDVVFEGVSNQGPMQPPEPGAALKGAPEQGATPPLEKGWEKKLKIETGEGEGSREVSPAGGGSAKSARKGGSRTQPGGVMALCKEVVLSLSAHRAGHLFRDIDYESFPGGDQIERKLDLNTIRHNVDDGVYDAEGSAAFYTDVQAMCDNVTAAFPPDSGEHVAATALRAFAHGEMGLVWKTEEMIRDGARSSRRPPPKFEPFQATPRRSPLGKSEAANALGGGTGQASRPQSKGRSRLGTPTGPPPEEGKEEGDDEEEVEEIGEGGEVEAESKSSKGKRKGGVKGGSDAATPKGGAGGKGKSAPKGEETAFAEEKGSTPKGDGKAGGRQKAKPKASPKTEPKPPSKSHKKQQPAPKSEPAKKTGGGVKVSQAAKASPVGEISEIEEPKKGKGVKRALESIAEPEKKKSHKKARR
ncbi:hypothetical protein KFL_000820200 [Klebsormidium nitens]|uniref:Myb-like domain-containing protein n=1 Tax=Klebsormidium nitens TaxID=105231 RepID=A0A1Y1HTQ7_KLENI|nr:hypothetical protein KFL_000820200 [Klebsormidium nitens]|eukprot:GAQ81513.1 hypothetical protein KFL_000820200 [Klebsormidium nitens]